MDWWSKVKIHQLQIHKGSETYFFFLGSEFDYQNSLIITTDKTGNSLASSPRLFTPLLKPVVVHLSMLSSLNGE